MSRNRKFKRILAPDGLEEMDRFTQFVKDAKALAKYVKDIKDLIADGNEVVARVGKAREIDSLRAQAQLDADKASRTVAEAQDEASRIVESAEMSMKQERSALVAQEDTIVHRRSALTRATKKAVDESADREKALQDREQAFVIRKGESDAELTARAMALADREKAAEKQMESANAIKSKYERRWASIQEAARGGGGG